jgi:bifunctional DNA-binding transcriptional regulator/antitoxin component of YhaV-PrlF toxin-antitoxin module
VFNDTRQRSIQLNIVIKEVDMPKVSKKRQVTLPIAQCRAANIKPGDFVETFLYQGQITIVKKTKGAAKGVLRHINPKTHTSDTKSVQDFLGRKHAVKQDKDD